MLNNINSLPVAFNSCSQNIARKNSRDNNSQSPKNNSITFKGDPKLNLLDKFLIAVASTKPMQKVAKWGAKEFNEVGKYGEKIVKRNYEKLGLFLMIGVSAFNNANKILSISKNKKIPDERKKYLCTMDVLTFAIPTIGALTIDGALNKGTKRFQNYLQEVNNNKLSPQAIKGVGAVKGILVGAIMYKYLSTLVAMPIATKIIKAVDKKNEKKAALGQDNKPKTAQKA